MIYFFFNDTAPTKIYTLPLPNALPIWRAGLVVAEVALSLVLLVGAGLLVRSLARLLDADPGFRTAGVTTMYVTLPDLRYEGKDDLTRFHRQALERLAALPGVEAACVSNTLPGLPSWQNDIAVEGYKSAGPGGELNVDWSMVSEDYFRVMGI